MCLWTLEAPTAGLNTEWFFLMQARAHFTRAWRRGSYLNLPGPETLGVAVDTPGEEKTQSLGRTQGQCLSFSALWLPW